MDSLNSLVNKNLKYKIQKWMFQWVVKRLMEEPPYQELLPDLCSGCTHPDMLGMMPHFWLLKKALNQAR